MRSTILRHDSATGTTAAVAAADGPGGNAGHGAAAATGRPQQRTADHGGECAAPESARRADGQDAVVFELCSGLFASMPRTDQRVKAIHYVRGLLGAEGRKSIRNIATLLGGDAAEQSLHHFISSSTWDWTPVRRALAQHIERVAPPQAYVVQPMIIPKAGETSVGVERRFVPELGQVINAQQAVGVWAAADDWSSPLHWRLHLTQRWLEDENRRNQASIPDTTVQESLAQCSVEAYLQMIRGSGLPVRPLVMDARHSDIVTTVHRLRAAGTPWLLRVDPSVRLTVLEATFPRRGASMTAQQIMSTAWHMRQLEPRRQAPGQAGPPGRTGLPGVPGQPDRHARQGPQPGQAGHLRAVRGPGSLVAVAATLTADTRLPGGRPGGRPEELLLLGVTDDGQWPAELWLTDLTGLRPAELTQLIRLTHRVERDLTEVADQVGIRDFSGRSFNGWHRHATLASAAHAIALLSGRPQARRVPRDVADLTDPVRPGGLGAGYLTDLGDRPDLAS
ncbi:transposase [Streptomyces sp. NBC_00249]|uniref:IS701 family transposase n=1 Tax=Streptomyces sp. NBC_00249 TaxID=2975690 RepID=UPI00225A4388|nr:transposase [Streptomyces sp. NBC_00249]MCX5197296.1 transposase [Streptomyces sp. NBC_00249]